MSEMPVFFESNSSNEPPKIPHKTVRLNIDLTQINSGSVIFNYTKLLNEERIKRERGDTRDGKSEKDLKKLKFTDTRYHSYAELGAGYDDDDSFIDNTDANEEGLPENMDTKYGGYYINYGELELKKTSSRQETSSCSRTTISSESESSEEEDVKKPPIRKETQESSDFKKQPSEIEVKKKAKVINVPLREKNNSNNSIFSMTGLSHSIYSKDD